MQATELLRQYADYNAWMNRRLLDAAQRLSDEERDRDLGAFFGSINGTFNHLLVGDSIWLRRFSLAQGSGAAHLHEHLDRLYPQGPLDAVVANDAEAIRSARQAIDDLILGWAECLDAAQLEQPLAYQNMAGRPFRRKLGLLALHFFNHQTHHRGQLGTLLFQSGIDIGVTDLLHRIPDEH